MCFFVNLSAVESKPASEDRIKTGHFFPLNRWKSPWQGMIEDCLDWSAADQYHRLALTRDSLRFYASSRTL